MKDKARILVVDDEESIRCTFEIFLTDEGYSVITASNGQEAMKCLKEETVDLVFLDVILQSESGLDVLREMRRRNLNCPVIVITGGPSVQTASQAFALDAFGHISKPVTQEKLLRLTKTVLG
jgi:DNA-binding NtrC family response regulator